MAMKDLEALERETDEMRLAREALSKALERVFAPTSRLSDLDFDQARIFAEDNGWKETRPPRPHCTVEEFLASYTR